MNKLNYGISILIAFIISGVCFWQGAGKFSEHNRYPTEGIAAEAYPTSDHYTETRRRFGIKSYDTDLAFKTPEGQVVHLKGANISSDELAALQEGKNIVREYLPEDPQGTARRQGDMIGIWVFLAIGVIALGFALAWLKSLFGKQPDASSQTASNEGA